MTDCDLQNETYRDARADWWENEAEACQRLDLIRLAIQCLLNADAWRSGGSLAEMLDEVA